jgi:predicted nucleotidyltransferase
MLGKSTNPTPYPEVNGLVRELLERVQRILGSHFVGMYLEGSLASGDFDQDSDIDFVVVTDVDISARLFSALRAMHEQITTIDARYANRLEGSYISRHALRRYDPEHARHPSIAWGTGESLKMVYHDETWVVHRYLLREGGITVSGPAPKTLIDPVLPSELRQAVLKMLRGWATQILDNPSQIKHRGDQSYTVLSLCRILYTLENGSVVSKSVAARWAQATLGEPWASLIERAWEGRHTPGLEASVDEMNGTLEFIRYSLERGRQFAVLMES